MTIQSNFSLKNYNTFGIEAKAKQFTAVHSLADLKTVLVENPTEKKIYSRRRKQYAFDSRH